MKNAYAIEEILNLVPEEEHRYSSTDTVSKEKVVAFRTEPALQNLLEALTEKWNTAGVSETVRVILSMYFLPVVYELEWKNLKPEQFQSFLNEQKEQGFSHNLARFNKFMLEVSEYLTFLNEAQERSTESIEYITRTKNKLEGILQEVEKNLQKVLVENEVEK